MKMCVAALTALALAQAAGAGISFQDPVSFSVTYRPEGVMIANLFGDGANEVALALDNPQRVVVFSSVGGGLMNVLDTFHINGSGIGDMAPSDVDGDGDLDLAVIMHNNHAIRFMLNDGSRLTAGPLATVGANARGMTSGDFDNDGDTDFALANRDGNSFSVVSDTGAATFSSATFAAGEEPRNVASADVNADGFLDLVSANHDDRTLRVHLGNGAGGFSNGAVINMGNRPDAVATGDIDGDGDQDLIVSTTGISIYKNNGSGIFTAAGTFPTLGVDPADMVVGDLDVDGDLDVAVANETSGTISLLENLGTGAFMAPQVIPTGDHPDGIAIGDINGDGAVDLAVTNRDSNSVSVLLNSSIPIPPPVIGNCPNDFNRDGDIGTDADIEAFFRCLAGTCCETCHTADLNVDGDIGTDADIEFFFVALAGNC